MPLEPIAEPVVETEASLAAKAAAQTIQSVLALAAQIAHKRANGIPGRAAQPERIVGTRVLPAVPAVPAVSPEAFEAALGANNIAILDALKAAI